MKKLLFILSLFFTLTASAQWSIMQKLGAPNSLIENQGWFKVDKVPLGFDDDSVVVFHNGVFSMVARNLFGSTTVINDSLAAIDLSLYTLQTALIDTAAALRNLMPQYFWAADPLLGSSGHTIHTMDTVKVRQSFLDSVRYAIDQVYLAAGSDYVTNTDFTSFQTTIYGSLDSLAALSPSGVDSVRIDTTSSGIYNKTITTFFSNGSTYTKPWIDNTGQRYKTLVCELAQSGTSDPVLTIHENDFGTLTATRISAGLYYIITTLPVTTGVWISGSGNYFGTKSVSTVFYNTSGTYGGYYQLTPYYSYTGDVLAIEIDIIDATGVAADLSTVLGSDGASIYIPEIRLYPE